MPPATTADAGRRDGLRGRVMPAAAATAIAVGAVAAVGGADVAADAVWATAVAALLVVLIGDVAAKLAAGRIGVDAIALLAMAGSLALGEYLAGAVIALMLSGGDALEASAARRAQRELGELLRRAPKVAHLHRDGRIVEVTVDAVRAGDVVAVRSGDIVPVDGTVASDDAVVDESTLTGEPLPVRYRRGEAVRSGTANAGPPFDLRADRRASDSAYAALVRL